MNNILIVHYQDLRKRQGMSSLHETTENPLVGYSIFYLRR